MSARTVCFPVVMFMVTIYNDTIIQVMDTVMFFICYMCICLCVICCVHLCLHVYWDRNKLWPTYPPSITAEEEVISRQARPEEWAELLEASNHAHQCVSCFHCINCMQVYEEAQQRQYAKQASREQKSLQKSLKRLGPWSKRSSYPWYME
jgi:hypothetical protein